MNRRIYECIYSYVPNAYMQTYLISRRSSLLFATFVASVARAVVVAKTRATAQSATCIVYLQVLWYFSRPLFSSPFLTLLALIKLCVCECVYYYYYAQLCTRLQLLIIIMNPCPPFPSLSFSLAIDAFLFIAAINKFSQCGNATNKSKTTTTTVKSAMNNEQCRLGE